MEEDSAMSAEVDPASWLTIPELIELAQGCTSALAPNVDDGQITITDRPKFMRLSAEPFPDLKGRHLENLRDLCVAAHRSEEFFLRSADAKQWVRTAVKSNRACELELFSQSLLEGDSPRRIVSDIFLHSNVLPFHPFWPKPPAVRDATGRTRGHFPCCILKEALEHNETLFTKLRLWQGECELGTPFEDLQQSPSEPTFLDILPKEVSKVKRLTEDVWYVTWRGGHFIAKDRTSETELKVVAELCHPHVVYIFGRTCVQHGCSIYMEQMETDLQIVILTKDRPEFYPPFSHRESIDILWQVAKAMTHLHEKNVIHGDLKTQNILISKFKISESQSYYLAKVADFGSAMVYIKGETFLPGNPTTLYAAPEVQKTFLRNDDVVISDPTKIDVFSFGIIGFEVLTGEKLYKEALQRRPWSTIKSEIISGDLRPPLREDFIGPGKMYLQDDRVINLIERCWLQEPSKRPPFSDIVNVLDKIRTDYLATDNDPNANGHAPHVERRARKSFGEFLRHFSCGKVGK